ncbi:MAG: 4-hydroxyphenylacetate decarboxylase activase [Alphaproteobacteria bacterium]|nr:4-hydroxyphenylacetate decarboxylase activase [Alphaproteobacteria bacterium]
MTNEKQSRALIFDIQAFSVHDGPGCRTNVFFSGCPLRCKWCANPENFETKPHLMFSDKVCKWKNGCRACVKRCKKNGVVFDEISGPKINWKICSECTSFECTKYCAAHSLKVCGKYYSVDELMNVLIRDSSNWGLDGGVTFSGGEPLLQYDFLLQVLEKCKEKMIHTAVETSANIPSEKFWNLMQYINFAFVDVKNMDDEKHKLGTGVSNKQTLSNISMLKEKKWKGRLVLRYPVIANFNDSIENAQKIIKFMKQNNLFEINILKFHRLGQSKWEQLGQKYAYEIGGDVSLDYMNKLQELYLKNDIICYVADNTSF